MKKASLFFVITSLFFSSGIAQNDNGKKKLHPGGKGNEISVGANIPLGNFNNTHTVGIAVEYLLSNYRFGKMDIKPVKQFGFSANAGMAYYFGKKEIISGYPYDYPGYVFVHAYAGVIYNPWKKENINLTIGPALGIYHGSTKFNIGSKLEGSYYVSERIAITPGIIMMKESGADALWTASLKATLAF
jgi:hypothetical protein